MNLRPLLGISLSLAALMAPLAIWLLPTEPVQAAASVSITDNAFVPQTLTVLPGETVTWTNDGVNLHTATSDLAYWNSGNLSPRQSYSFTFLNPGTYTYYCSFHTVVGMTGTIVALPPTSTPAPPTATTTMRPPTPTPTVMRSGNPHPPGDMGLEARHQTLTPRED